MELRQLRYFLAVARTMNFTRAAEEMHIAQPPLSRQISHLEDELGVRLIDRDARPMRLTGSGSFFRDRAQEIISRVDRLKQETMTHGEGRQTLRIGFEVSVLYGHLSPIIKHLRDANPHLEIDLKEMSAPEQVVAIRNGTADLGIGRELIADDAIVQTVIRQEPMLVALPVQHRSAQNSTLRFSDLEGETMIFYQESSSTKLAHPVARLMDRASFAPTRRTDIGDVLAALSLVAAEVGVCIVPATVQRMRAVDVCYVPLDEPGAMSSIVLSVLRGSALPIVDQIKRELDRILGANPTAPQAITGGAS